MESNRLAKAQQLVAMFEESPRARVPVLYEEQLSTQLESGSTCSSHLDARTTVTMAASLVHSNTEHRNVTKM